MTAEPVGAPKRLAVVAHRDKLPGRDAKKLRAALLAAGLDDAPWFEIDKGSLGTKAARKALKTGAEVVLVCGGDGTVRAVAEALVGSEVALAVLPTGTANLFAGAFRLPTSPQAVVELICSGTTRRIDTGACNGQTFAVMAGAGFDAAMLDAADAGKDRLGTLAYVRAAVQQARRQEAFGARVVVDGATFFDGAASCVLVGNIGTLKGGIKAFPDASVTDGLLDVLIVTATGVREWAGVLAAAVRHRQRATANAHIGRGSEILVELDHKRRFELDGGTKGKSKRLVLSARPQSLVLCAPDAT